jgi:hypothetical protein
MTMIKVLLGVIIAAMVAVALVPMFVLVDLVGGGDGWGLCPDGVASCSTSYFDGLELAAMLVVTLFVLVAGLRIVVQVRRRLEGQSGRNTRSVGGGDRLRRR